MRLAPLDWLIVAGTLALAFLPALLYAGRAGRDTTEFFASGRSAPWWLIGISMVATTFAAAHVSCAHFARSISGSSSTSC